MRHVLAEYYPDLEYVSLYYHKSRRETSAINRQEIKRISDVLGVKNGSNVLQRTK